MPNIPDWAQELCCQGCMRHQGDLTTARFKRCKRCKTAYYCSTQCQRANWAEHKPYCEQSAATGLHPFLGHIYEEFPTFDRDCRRYTAAITPRLAEITLRALDLRTNPDNRGKMIVSLSVAYDPQGARDVQRFMPISCGVLQVPELLQRGGGVWRHVLEERERADAQVRSNRTAFGAAIMQVVVLPPREPTEQEVPSGQRTLFTTFETLRISDAQAQVAGDDNWARDLILWLQLLQRTGVVTPGRYDTHPIIDTLLAGKLTYLVTASTQYLYCRSR